MKRIPSLDGVRAISILLVVLGHLGLRERPPGTFWSYDPVTGVRIFFVVSGYLITQLLLREQDRTSTIKLKEFYIRRAFRIFPAALFFTLVITILYHREVRWFAIAAAFFYVADFDFHPAWIFIHLWSLSVEEQFYFVWPGVLKSWRKHAPFILTAVIVLAPCYEALLYHAHVNKAFVRTFPAVADALAAGCLLAIFAPRIGRIPGYAALLMLSVVVLVPLFAANTATRSLLLLFVLRPLLHFSIAGLLLRVVQTPPRLLNLAPVAWLGKISYSLYLWQQPFCYLPTHSGYFCLLALPCACFSYYLIEQPMLRLRDRLTRRPDSVVPEPLVPEGGRPFTVA
jgi:peptidoglycan/LPS O-acetylase OafA/YrhL